MTPVHFQGVHEGNPYFPLPPDYQELTPGGQSLARVNACSLLDTPEDAVRSWAFFRDYYLVPDPASGFDPGFYKPPYLPSPPLHYNLVRWLYSHPCTAVGAPRGSAKTTCKRSIILWEALTQPTREINTFLARDDFVIEEFYRYKLQLESNLRILEDFGVMQPERGAGIWSNHTLTLRNRSIIRGLSVESKKRGIRGDVFMDDIEYDEKAHLVSDRQASNLKESILKVIIPVMDADCRLMYVCTLVSRRGFSYHILRTTEDQRFLDVTKGGEWKKVILPAIGPDNFNTWRAKYTPEFLATKRRQMGDSFFATEYLNDPRSEQSAPFNIIPDQHEYIVGDDVLLSEDPFAHDTDLTYHESSQGEDPTSMEFTRKTSTWRTHLTSLTRVLAIDPAEGLKTENDYTAMVVVGLDSRNTLWVLEAWHGRRTPEARAQKAWELSKKWKVSQVGVESYSTQMNIHRMIRNWMTFQGGDTWTPVVVPLKPPTNLSKPDKIMMLEWRFNQGRIKLPSQLSRTVHIGELYRQIRNFTPDLRGLEHDDLIDALALSQYMLRSGGPQRLPMASGESLEDLFLAGHTMYPGTDVSLVSAIDWKRLPDSVIMELIQRKKDAGGSVLDWDNEDELPSPGIPHMGVLPPHMEL